MTRLGEVAVSALGVVALGGVALGVGAATQPVVPVPPSTTVAAGGYDEDDDEVVEMWADLMFAIDPQHWVDVTGDGTGD